MPLPASILFLNEMIEPPFVANPTRFPKIAFPEILTVVPVSAVIPKALLRSERFVAVTTPAATAMPLWVKPSMTVFSIATEAAASTFMPFIPLDVPFILRPRMRTMAVALLMIMPLVDDARMPPCVPVQSRVIDLIKAPPRTRPDPGS